MNKYFINLLIFTFLVLSLQAKDKDKDLQKVTLQLQWKHQFEFAGFYAAVEKGFYKDVGLDVTLVEFNKTKGITDEVLNGNAEYGLSYSTLIAQYYDGKPLVFIANFFKQSPLVLIAQEYIKTPADLKNKKIMGLSDTIHNITLLSMLNRFNIDLDEIKNINTNFKLDDFINKKVDAMSVFTTNELYYLDKQGIKYNIFDPIVYGAKYYDSNLFTSQKELLEHPKRVQALKSASIKGWQYALTHKDELIEIILKKYNTQNKSKEALEFEANQVEYIMLPDVYDIGSIDKTRVKIILDSFIQAGFVKKHNNRDISSFIYHDKKNPLNLTQKEKLFIKNHSKIVLGTEKMWEPYVVVLDNGEVTGYDADVLKLINEVSGANFQLKAGNWSQMQEEAKTRVIDGLSTGAIHDERKHYLNFSDIYIEIQKMIIVSKENPKNIFNRKDLVGKTIAIHKSNLVDEKLSKEFPNSHILRFDNLKDVLNSVASGKADALFGNAATIYTANKLGITYLKYSGELNKSLQLAFGVRKDWPEAIAILNKSLHYISQHKLLELKNKWFFQKNIYKKVFFTTQELEYMKTKKEILMCIDSDWMPFEAYSNGKYKGINSDFIKLFKHDITIPIKILKTENWDESLKAIKENRCDILSLVSKTKQKAEYLTFTSPYLESNLIITAKVDKKSVLDISHLSGKKIAVVKGYAASEILKENYPNLNIIEVANVQEGLLKLENDEVYGYAGSAIVNEYYFEKGDYSDFKTIAYFDEKLSLGIAISKENSILHSILQKTVSKLEDDQKQTIIKKWSYQKYPTSFNNELFVKLLIAIAIVILFGIYRHFSIQKSNKELKIKVQEELKKSKDKDQMIFHQNKLIAMGEMIENIAHQWRQPLSQVNSAVLLIDDLLYQNNIKNKKIEEKLLEIEHLTKYMSKTIDDFKNFFDQNKKREKFNLHEPIEKAISILKGVLKSNHIHLVSKFDTTITCNCYPNELQQVILVLVNNAIDALLTNHIENPYILIESKKINNQILINISDNAGGIKQDLKHKIFEPYFTTKHKKQGTGLGLYLAKIIIEESLEGELTMINNPSGAKFTIRINYNDIE